MHYVRKQVGLRKRIKPMSKIRQGLPIEPFAVSCRELAHEREDGDVRQTSVWSANIWAGQQALIEQC